jgi:hypothetical protein
LNQILFPINSNSDHWILIVVDFNRRRVCSLDSIPSKDALHHSEKISLILSYIEQEIRAKCESQQEKDIIVKDFETWDILSMKCPLQKNYHDCGVFLLANLLSITTTKHFNFSQEDIKRFRYLIALQLIQKNIDANRFSMKKTIPRSWYICDRERSIVPRLYYIDHSEIHGFGLFSKYSILSGQEICCYSGEIISDEELENKNYDSSEHYLMSIDKCLYVDAGTADKSGAARYVNECGKEKSPNCYFSWEAGFCHPVLIALRDIQKNKELTVEYGRYFSRRIDRKK